MLRVKSEFGETSIGIYVTPLNTEKEIVIEIRMISNLHIKDAHIFYISSIIIYSLSKDLFDWVVVVRREAPGFYEIYYCGSYLSPNI